MSRVIKGLVILALLWSSVAFQMAHTESVAALFVAWAAILISLFILASMLPESFVHQAHANEQAKRERRARRMEEEHDLDERWHATEDEKTLDAMKTPERPDQAEPWRYGY